MDGSSGMSTTNEGPTILVVEDEIIVSDLIADILRDSGLKVAGPFRSNHDCLIFLDHDRPDAAVLDFNIADGTSGPIALRLQALGVPFIIASAYPKEIASGPVASALRWISKPFSEASLTEGVCACLFSISFKT
ncbi:MAG: response regulator [Methylocystaceae bacterium]|nr:response regulator [Methylocystaceae bacterium]